MLCVEIQLMETEDAQARAAPPRVPHARAGGLSPLGPAVPGAALLTVDGTGFDLA